MVVLVVACSGIAFGQPDDVLIATQYEPGRPYFRPSIVARDGGCVIVCTHSIAQSTEYARQIRFWIPGDTVITPGNALLAAPAYTSTDMLGSTTVRSNMRFAAGGDAVVAGISRARIEWRNQPHGCPVLFDSWSYNSWLATAHGWVLILDSIGGTGANLVESRFGVSSEGLGIAGIVPYYVVSFTPDGIQRWRRPTPSLPAFPIDAIIPMDDTSALIVAAHILQRIGRSSNTPISNRFARASNATYYRLTNASLVRIVPPADTTTHIVWIERFGLDGTRLRSRQFELPERPLGIASAPSMRDSSILLAYGTEHGVFVVRIHGTDFSVSAPIRISASQTRAANPSITISNDSLYAAWEGRRNDTAGIFATAQPNTRLFTTNREHPPVPAAYTLHIRNPYCRGGYLELHATPSEAIALITSCLITTVEGRTIARYETGFRYSASGSLYVPTQGLIPGMYFITIVDSHAGHASARFVMMP